MKKVIIIGGGLSGLISAIRIARANIPCLLIERRAYPFHRVCGEYISNETIPFLKREKLFPDQFNPPAIDRFQLSSVSGKSQILPLDMGGFGISRFAYDHFLYQLALQSGVEVSLRQEVDDVIFNQRKNEFTVRVGQQLYTSEFVVGSHGKRSKLDNTLSRKFMLRRSPYVGIKYHIRTRHPENLIALHNFRGGYCGISNIEEGKTNLCYLIQRSILKKYKSIPDLEREVLCVNPFLASIFLNAEFLFDKPEVINEISFEAKEPVLNHILMAGDAAGMIAPLCGNGMAMAIRSGKMVSDLIIQANLENKNRTWIEDSYSRQWKETFANRLLAGRVIQNNLFGNALSSLLAVNLAIHSKSLTNFIIRNTHGEVF